MASDLRRAPARHLVVGALVLAPLLLVTACSGDDSPEPPARSTSPADARANLAILTDDELPDGWRRADPADRLAGNPGKPSYCGVEVEPDDVEEGRVPYYESTSLPNAILSYVMVASEASASQKLEELQAAVADCEEPGFDVTPVPEADVAGVGDQAVALDLVGSDDPSLRSRTLVFRRGEVLVTLVATGTTKVPVAEQLAVAKAVDANLQG